VVSRSDGRIDVLSWRDDALVHELGWHAHGFEAWIAAFHYHQPATVFTGRCIDSSALLVVSLISIPNRRR
jgi:hypothetical protein